MKPTEASRTARVIAASTILLGSDPRTAALVAPGAADLCRTFLSGSLADRWLARSVEWPPTRALWRWVERQTLPGIVAHYWHRKRWIEERFRNAVDRTWERIVVLGAGFDTLSYRLAHEFPQLDAIEFDHPATQGVKRRSLPSGRSPENLRFVTCDLSREPLPMDLLGDGAATVVVAEGLLMYLPTARIAHVFDALRTIPAKRLRVLFSFMTRWPDGSIGFRPRSWVIERWLAWHKEPFTWGIDPQSMPDFLAAHGFRLVAMASAAELADASAVRSSRLEGENLVMCEPA